MPPIDPITVGSLLASVGSGVSGIFGAKKAKQKNRDIRAHGEYILGNLQGAENYFGGRQEDYLLQRLGLLGGAYDDARMQVSRIGNQAKRDILDRGAAREARIGSQAISAGLSSSTSGINAQALSNSLTSRELGDVDESLAGLQAGLITQGAGAQANALGDLSNFYGLRYDRRAGIEGQRFGLFTGQQYVPQTYDFGGLGSALDDTFDYLGLFQ